VVAKISVTKLDSSTLQNIKKSEIKVSGTRAKDRAKDFWKKFSMSGCGSMDLQRRIDRLTKRKNQRKDKLPKVYMITDIPANLNPKDVKSLNKIVKEVHDKFGPGEKVECWYLGTCTDGTHVFICFWPGDYGTVLLGGTCGLT